MSHSDVQDAAKRLEREAQEIQRGAQREWASGQLTLGVILLTIGGVFTAHRLGYVEVDELWRLWPLVFVVIAVSHLIGRSEGALRSAFSMLFMAAIFFMHNFAVVRIWYSWPLFIVLAGIMTIWNAFAGPVCKRHKA